MKLGALHAANYHFHRRETMPRAVAKTICLCRPSRGWVDRFYIPAESCRTGRADLFPTQETRHRVCRRAGHRDASHLSRCDSRAAADISSAIRCCKCLGKGPAGQYAARTKAHSSVQSFCPTGPCMVTELIPPRLPGRRG